MNPTLKPTLTFALCALVLAGCATNSGVLPVGPDTYTVSTGADNFRGGLAGAKKEAYRQASDYCASKSMQLLVLETTGSQNGFGKPVAEYDLTFRCLQAGDPELQRPTVETRPDSVIEIRR